MIRDRDRYRSDYRTPGPEPPRGWHEQDWLLILEALDYYALEGYLPPDQELRAYQLVEAIAQLHGTCLSCAYDRRDVEHFDQLHYVVDTLTQRTRSRRLLC